MPGPQEKALSKTFMAARTGPSLGSEILTKAATGMAPPVRGRV
jgi:hypothetical protein